MKAYLVVTAFVFGLLTAAHIWRAIVESSLATNPWFLLITVIAAILCVWACRLLLTGRDRPAAVKDGSA